MPRFFNCWYYIAIVYSLSYHNSIMYSLTLVAVRIVVGIVLLIQAPILYFGGSRAGVRGNAGHVSAPACSSQM